VHDSSDTEIGKISRATASDYAEAWVVVGYNLVSINSYLQRNRQSLCMMYV